MKELSGIIEVYPITGLPSDFSTTDLSSGKYEKFEFHTNKFVLEPTPEETSGGITYNCDKEIVVDNFNNKSLNQLFIRTSCIIRLKDTTGNEIILGTYYIPATVLLIPYLNRYKLSIHCKTLNSPYL